ncbi:hypothetical protein Xaut_3688 [Xanthobacter versatilis]|uniref:Uncharacterized protein n=1 Tax=Xanthobacter autotrophicus (strain ATCC BAA-1158 / Py2) TaxID=78245 RepID=A7ILM2_XANP2|nr:hypothetical protein Xaut_3688 [Xanthobacter autotrophicus Py2]
MDVEERPGGRPVGSARPLHVIDEVGLFAGDAAGAGGFKCVQFRQQIFDGRLGDDDAARGQECQFVFPLTFDHRNFVGEIRLLVRARRPVAPSPGVRQALGDRVEMIGGGHVGVPSFSMGRQ